MESLDNDKVPVLKISYEQLCEKIRAQEKNIVVEIRDGIGGIDYVDRKRANSNKIGHSKDERENGRKLTASMLKQSLESSSKSTNGEKVWQQAWSRFNIFKADLDRTISSCVKIDYDQFRKAIKQCTFLEGLGKDMYTENTDVAFKHDLVAKIWRTAHYPVTELMRKLYKTAVDSEKSGLMEMLTSFLNHLMEYYSTLITILQQHCGFELSVLIGDSGTTNSQPTVDTSKTYHRKLKQSINVCHQCYIFMGDTARYSEELSAMPQWSRPRKYYLKSVHLVPKNGHPYNQLAVIAINSHRRLDAVYYYIRSLCSKNVFLSANDSLVTIFDETAKKAKTDEINEKSKLSKEKKKSRKKNELIQNTNSREVWIMPGRKVLDAKEEISSSIITIDNTNKDITNPSELSKKLVNSFLIIHGKLFSRIGIDTFNQCKNNCLVLLKSYLQTTGLTVTKDGERFIMMIAINIFSVNQKIVESKDSDSNLFYFILSLSFGLEFITQIINHMSHDDHVTHIKESLIILLPCVRVWLSWLFDNLQEWSNLISHPGLQSSVYEFFTGFSTLLNYITDQMPMLEKDKVSLSFGNKFWEDKLLAGFTPLMLDGDYLSYPDLHSLSQEHHYCQCMLRITSLMDLGTQVSHNDMVPLLLATDTGKFSVTMVIAICPPIQTPLAQCDNDSDLEELYTSNNDQSDDNVEDVSLQIQVLKLERERLSKQMKSQLQTEQASQSLLDETQLTANSIVTIKPKYLVPDTNCFINNLDLLKSLINSEQFIVAVPLTVKAELDGLCKGNQLTTEQDITLSTQLAVNYISSNISSSLYLKILTSQGNLLSSLNITTELTDKATNDDIILTSCLKLHDRINNNNYYSVVLLTDDRNLRVKSHASHMPVKDVQTFIDLYIQQTQ